MKYKKIASVSLATMLLTFSASAFASGASYSVHDDEVRSTLSEIHGQVDEILKYLDVIKEKELSMDLMNKAAVERTNDNMTKLTPTSDMSFIDSNDHSIDWNSLLKGGSGRFLEQFGKDMAKKGFDLTQFAKGTDLFTVSLDDFIMQFDGIRTGSNFEGLTDPTAIKTVYVQNLQELSKAELKIDEEVAEYDKKKKEIDDKDTQRVEDVTKAQDSKSDDRNNLWSSLGGFGNLLGGKYGASLDPTSLHTIFLKEGTESATAAQERTTSVDVVRANKEIRDAEQKAVHMQARIKKDKIQLLIQINEANLAIALGNAESAAIKALPVNTTGSKHKCVFDD